MRSRDDRGSVAVALLVSIVGAMLAMLLLPMLLVQVRSTRQVADRVRALHAAEAGLELALAQIRSAADDSGAGSAAQLPCGPLAGTVGQAGTARYEVSIDYFTADPKGQSDSWLTANRIRCVAGAGTMTVPAYALVRARGTRSPTGAMGTVPTRYLSATYVFWLANKLILGGEIRGEQSSGGAPNNLCYDAGSSDPSSGTPIQIQVCDEGSERQTWAYEKNLTIRLVSSSTTARPLGLCLDAGSPQNVGDPVLLQPCGAATEPDQQWSYDDQSRYAGLLNGADRMCIGLSAGNVAGSFLTMAKCKSGGVRFRPTSQVGAGAAGAETNQLVNFEQFGRCLDVPNKTIDSTFLISWPCKQEPDPAKLSWNQVWVQPEPGTPDRITVTYKDGTQHCLTSPESSGAGAYPVLMPCPSDGTPQTMIWTVTRKSPVYAESYRVSDALGRCLAVDPTDLYRGETSRVIVTECTASGRQKWNAPPTLLDPAFKDIGER